MCWEKLLGCKKYEYVEDESVERRELKWVTVRSTDDIRKRKQVAPERDKDSS